MALKKLLCAGKCFYFGSNDRFSRATTINKNKRLALMPYLYDKLSRKTNECFFICEQRQESECRKLWTQQWRMQGHLFGSGPNYVGNKQMGEVFKRKWTRRKRFDATLNWFVQKALGHPLINDESCKVIVVKRIVSKFLSKQVGIVTAGLTLDVQKVCVEKISHPQ